MIVNSPFHPDHEQGAQDLVLTIQRHEFGIPITLEEQPDLMDIPWRKRKSMPASTSYSICKTLTGSGRPWRGCRALEPFMFSNVAGPREREAPGIYEEARRFLRQVLRPD